MSTHARHREWRRLLLTLTPEAGRALDELARVNSRDRRREALRLLTEAIEREHATLTVDPESETGGD